jgi:hypothetical protein
MSDEFVVGNFGIFGEGASEGEIEVGVVVAPEGGDDWGDDEGDLAVGEAEESGGAAFENVGVGTLGFPRESVERGEHGDFAGERPGGAGSARENGGEEAEGVSEGFGAFVGGSDEEGGAAEGVCYVSHEETLGYVMKAREGDFVGVGTQGGECAFDCGLAQEGFQAFADCGENHLAESFAFVLLGIG